MSLITVKVEVTALVSVLKEILVVLRDVAAELSYIGGKVGGK